LRNAIYFYDISIDYDRCPRENHIPWATRIIIVRNLCIHILSRLPLPPPFSICEFLSFGKFFTLPVCPIVDISKCTNMTQSPANGNKETGQRKTIVEYLYSTFLLIFVIKDDKKRGMKVKCICASRDSMQIEYLNIFYIPQQELLLFFIHIFLLMD